MNRWAITGVALLITTPASGQALPASGQIPSPATGSPSNGAATVSPSTVSDTLDRVNSSGSSFDLSLGSSYASGDFGSASQTHIWSTSFGARYTTAGGLRFSLSIPYMRIRSEGTIYTGIDSTPVVAAATGMGRRVTASGLGDLTLGASYAIDGPVQGLEFELSGRLKVPTASRGSMLSTRKTDYSLGMQLTKTAGRLAPFISATYRIFGDPQAFNLRNGFAASAGASFIVGDRTVLLASYHYAQAATRFVSDSHEMFVGASTPLGDGRVRLTGFGTAGLSHGAPGISGGAALSVKL